MEEVRNLSGEAALLAIRQFAAMNPRMGDDVTRKNLSPQEKEQVFVMLNMMAEQLEASLIEEIRYGRRD